MELSFETKFLRDACENQDFSNSEFGKKVSARLRSRLADLRAATSVLDLIVGNPSEIQGFHVHTYKIDLCDGFVLTFISNHTTAPLEEGKINWEKVNRIKILSIGKL